MYTLKILKEFQGVPLRLARANRIGRDLCIRDEGSAWVADLLCQEMLRGLHVYVGDVIAVSRICGKIGVAYAYL